MPTVHHTTRASAELTTTATKHLVRPSYSRASPSWSLDFKTIFNGKPWSDDQIAQFIPYVNEAHSTSKELSILLKSIETKDQTVYNGDPHSAPIICLLKIIQRDTEGFLRSVGDVLQEIGLNSADDYLLEQRLSHWRGLITRFQAELPDMRSSLESLLTFLRELSIPHADPDFMNHTLKQIDSYIEQSKKSYEALRADVALLENKRGIAQAESVGKLTELGFVFIPISCVAAIFSMQIDELQNHVSLWVFIIGASIALVTAYSARLVIRSAAIRLFLRNQAARIRARENLPLGAEIPTRCVLHYLLTFGPFESSSRTIPYILQSVVFMIPFTLPIAFVWTRTQLEASFKSIAMTLIISFNAAIIFNLHSFLRKSELPRERRLPYYGFRTRRESYRKNDQDSICYSTQAEPGSPPDVLPTDSNTSQGDSHIGLKLKQWLRRPRGDTTETEEQIELP